MGAYPAVVCLSDNVPREAVTLYQPVERRKVYEQIADQLLGQIGARALKPGDVLPPERELTESFGVGRSSIREALRMLESQGVITTVNGGAFVVADAAHPLNSSLRLMFTLGDRAGMHDLFELRRILDVEAAALAAERHEAEHLVEMDAAVEEMTASLEDATAFIEADLRFHLVVAEAAQNRFVLHTMQAVSDVVRRALVAAFVIPQSPEKAVFEHREVRAAIASGDSSRARQTMSNHLARVASDVERRAAHG